MNKIYKGFILLLGIACIAIFYKEYGKKENIYIVERYNEQQSLLKTYGELSYNEMSKLDKRDRPDLAFLQEFEKTMDPALGYPPTKRKLEAFKVAKQMLAKKTNQQAAIENVKWTERGPNNVGGRTRALMFDPNDANAKKVWAGAIGGGLWYTNDITDVAAKWIAVNDLMSNLAISSLAFDPSNTQVYYMGTGLGYTNDIQGEGIWKSTDAGATWNRLSSTETRTFNFVQKIEVTADGIVLANTLNGTMRSSDGGDSWTNVNSGRMGDLEITSDGTIYSTQGANSTGAIFKSVDKGLTWTDITPSSNTSPTRIEIVSAPSDPNRLYAVADGGSGSTDVAFFMKSEDAGETWTDITIPPETDQSCVATTNHFTRGQAFFDLIMMVDPRNPDVVLVGGIDIYRTTDGGENWGLISYWTGINNCDDYVHADQHAMISRPGFPNEAIFGNDGGVFYSLDVFKPNANPDFIERNNGYNVTTFYATATINEINSNYFLAGAQDNGTQQLNSVGIGSSTEVTGGDGAFCFIDQDNPDVQITSFIYNSYRVSLDRGVTFNAISDDQNKGRFINPSEYDSDANILYGAGNRDELSRIADLTVASPTLEYVALSFGGNQITTIKASPYTENRLFVGVSSGAGGRIYKIDNANANAPSVVEVTGTFTGSPGTSVSSIDIGATDDQLLATFSNYGVNSVYESLDGGVNWTNKEDNLPDMPVRWGLYNPKNRDEVLLATEVGVWSTNAFSTANPNWEPTNSGLANVRCDMLKYRASDEMVVVATYGRGIYTTNVFASTKDANFGTKQTIGYVGVPVDFEDASLLPNESWAWDFGDGNTSTVQNPSYAYTQAGTYDVSLSIDGGTDTETKTGYVTILPLKSTPYTPADGGDFESNPNDFTSRALKNGVNHWERGVPSNRLVTVNSGSNAWKTGLDKDIEDVGLDYASALYTPAFDLSNTNKSYKVKFRKSMENAFCNSPHAMQMQYSIDGGKKWFTLGTSFPEFGSVNWYNRGDNTGCDIQGSIFNNNMGWTAQNLTQNGTPADFTIDNENTEYDLKKFIGQSAISFRFVSGVGTGSGTDDNGSLYNRDGFMIDDFEIVVSDAGAEFGADNLVTVVNQKVNFTYLSSGAQSFNWDFGDGETSNLENPSHSYSNPGPYTVSLTITSSAGTLTETKNDFISVLAQRSIPYSLSDGGNFDVNQTDFGVENISGTPFELGNSTISGKDGTTSGEFAWVTGLDDAEYVDRSEARLFSPIFGFNSAGSYTLKFKAKYAFEDNFDGFIVEYSTDLASSWTKLNDNQEDGWYNQITDPAGTTVFGGSVPFFSGNTNGAYSEFSTDVSFLYPNPNVIFRFFYLTDGGATDVGLAIDDFELEGPAPGPAVPNFTLEGGTGCDGQTVTFTNISTGTISALNWDFGANADPATATGIGPHSVTYTGTGSSTVSLTVESSVNGTQTEIKPDIVTSAALHTPTFTAESNEPYITTLTASDGDSYQWYLSGEAITTNGTSQVYQATAKGLYHVEVTIGGCTASSTNSNVTILSIEDDLFAREISVYPNPTQDNVTISISNEETGVIELNVYNLLGSKIMSRRLNKNSIDTELTINVSEFGYGTYLFELISEKARATKRVMIN